MTFPGHLFTRASGFSALFAGLTTATATDRYWDPLNNDTYQSTGYTTYTAAATVWNNTNAAFDVSPVNSANAAWAAGDDAFLNFAPDGTPQAAPAGTWFVRVGTTAPVVHNVTYDSTTAGSLLSLLANSTAGTNANMGLTGGANGASTWTVGADDTLRLSSGGGVGGATNVGVVNLVNASGVTTVDLVKEGAGRMHIQSTGSSFTGKVLINAGSVQINGNGSLGNTLNDVYIADGAMLTVNTGASVAVSRTIFLGNAAGGGTAMLDAQGTFTFTVDSLLANNGAGAGGLNKTNSGTVILSNLNNSYTGTTSVSGGTLRVANLADGGSVSAIGASSNAASNVVLNNGGVLSFVGASAVSTDRLFTIAGAATNISNNSVLSTNTLVWTNSGAIVNTATGPHAFTLGGSNTGANIFAPSLADNGANLLSFVKGGASNWTLTGTHTYSGTTTIGNGTAGGGLEFNGNLIGPGGIVDVTAGNRLSGSGAILRGAFVTGTLAPGSTNAPLGTLTVMGAVTFNVNAAFAVNLGGAAASKVSGVTDLTLNNNTMTVTLNAANLPSGTAYDILDYSGALTGTFNPAVAVAGLTGLTSRIAFGLDYATANKVRLTQAGQAKSLAWTGSDGANPTVWNVNSVANWNAGGTETFFDLDTVAFGDAAANRTVDVTTNVTPSAIVMNNLGAADYVISASTGAIIGPASFTKNGTANLAINGAHAFTGPFHLNGGTVTAGLLGDSLVPQPLGMGAIIFGGGRLDYTGASASTNRPIEFAAGGGTVSVPASVDFTFGAAITGVGGLVKTGAGILRLPGNNGFAGPVVVSAGVLKLGNNTSLGTTAAGTTVNAGATLDFAATANTLALPQDEVITVTGAGADLDGDLLPDGALVNYGTIQAQNAAKKVVLAGDTTMGGPQRFDVRIAGTAEAGFVAGTDAYFKGNGFNLTKVGTAQLGIAGVGETDLGNIEIKAGSLIFHDSGNGDLPMMLASDTTLGRVVDGGGNFYKVTIQPGATLQFFNSNGTRSKEIVTEGVGTNATISMNSDVGVAHTLTLNRGITASGGLTLNSADANVTNFIIDAVIAEGASAAALTKTGNGTVALLKTNTFSGGVTVSNGKLQIGNDGALGSGGISLTGTLSSIGDAARQIANPLTFTGNSTLGDLVDTGALTFASQVNFGNVARNLTVQSNVTFAAGYTSTAPGGLNQKLGIGTLRIGVGASVSSGVTEIRAGSIVLENGASLANGDAVRVMANTAGGSATLSLQSGSSLVIGLGTANLRIGHESATITDGTNIANIAGSLSFSAPTTGGNVQLGSDSALAQINLLAGGEIAARGVGLGVQTPAGAVTEFNFDGGTLRAIGDNGNFFPAVLSATKVKAGGGTIDSNGFVITVFQPLLHDSALGVLLDGGIRAAGAGTLTLAGANTYTGPTTVEGGTLVVAASGSIDASSLTEVKSGGVLSGGGAVGALKLNGGVIAPGPGTSVLSATRNVDFSGGIAFFEINGLIPGAEHDQLLAGAGGGSTVKISAPTELSLAINFSPQPGDSFLLIDNAGLAAIDTSFFFTVGGMAIPNYGVFDLGGTAYQLQYNGGDGNDLSLVVAVPEPGGMALLLGGLGLLVSSRRRRG